MTVTSLLRSGLPFVGSGQKHASSRPQNKHLPSRALASSSSAEAQSQVPQSGTEVLKRDLTKTLADLEALDAQLATATQQLGAEQVKGDTEREALEALQAQLMALQQPAKEQAGPEGIMEQPGWQKTMHTAEQIVALKALVTERDAEVADLERQLAEFEEPEEASVPAAAPALVPAGGLSADGMDEEGRERVAMLKRQLTQQLHSGLEQQFMQPFAPLPDTRSRKMAKRAFAEDILRSAKFPGLVLVTTASSVGDACKAAWSLVRRFRA